MNGKRPDSSSSNPTRLIITALALLALAVAFWRMSGMFVIAFGGIVIAALIRSLAEPLAGWTRVRDRWCVLMVVAALAIVLVLIGWVFGQQVANQAAELKQQLPEALGKLRAAVERTGAGKTLVTSIRQTAGDSKTLSNVGIAATAAIGGVFDVVLVLFLSIYFALDVRMYRDGALRLLPPAYRNRVGVVLDDAGEALQKWLLGQAVAMVTVGILVGIGLALVGVPLALALGIVAALLEFVPVIGPILFSIPGLLLAFAKGPQTVLYALVVYLIVQQFEGNVLIPLIQRWAVRLPPVVGLLAIVAGGLLLGVPGVVFATPLAVVIMRLVKHLYVEDALESGSSASNREATK